MKNIALTRVQSMQAYIPPVARSTFAGLCLDSNERMGPMSAVVRKAIVSFLRNKTVQTYPEYGELERAIGTYANVSYDCVMATSGSDQAISLVFRTFTDAGDTVIIPSPTFSMYAIAAQACGNSVRLPAYRDEPLIFPADEVRESITKKTKLIVICNPNNPTGTLTPIPVIERIAKKAPGAIVLVDEAYVEFSRVSAVRLLKKNPNIIIIRTFSKAFGLAGVRLGYVIANPSYIRELRKMRGPYDINSIAVAAGIAASNDTADMNAYVREVMDSAKPKLEQFFADNDIPFTASTANFLLFTPPNAPYVADILYKNGILVRKFSAPGLAGALRVTIGRSAETDRFIDIYTRCVLSKDKKSYAFIDRDGTLIYEPQDTFQVDSVKDLRVLPGVIEGLKNLQNSGFSLVMVTNQDGLGSANNPLASFNTVQRALLARLRKSGIRFEKIFICPHLPSDKCTCRKPNIGLVKSLQKTIDLKRSFMCGDRPSDEGFAKNLGIPFYRMQTNGNFLAAIQKRKETI